MADITRFSDLREIPSESRWFKLYQILPGVTAIFEPYHFQEVISYLIEGDESAVMFDSGMGIGNIKAVAQALTNKPITLINSHSHFDHVGGNWQFEHTHLLNVPECIKKLENGFSIPKDDENRSEEALNLEGNRWFDLKTFSVKPCSVIPIKEGDFFELGNRTLKVIATPGHSKDSIMLVDDANKILFTGDTVYPAPLYAYLEGKEQIPVYADTIHKLAKLYSNYTLCCSHNDPLWSGAALNDISNAFSLVLQGSLTGREDNGHTVYSFEDFSIVT